MLIFSFNKLTHKEFDCLQPCKRNIRTAIFYTKQNNLEAEGNIAFSFGVNKTSMYITDICANFQ